MNRKATLWDYIATLSILLLCGCGDPKLQRKDVSGEIVYVQYSVGWERKHTVIVCDDGYTVRVAGAYGNRGDKVKIKDAQIMP